MDEDLRDMWKEVLGDSYFKMFVLAIITFLATVISAIYTIQIGLTVVSVRIDFGFDVAVSLILATIGLVALWGAIVFFALRLVVLVLYAAHREAITPRSLPDPPSSYKREQRSNEKVGEE